MADAIQFTVPDSDFIELVGAGLSGSLLHQGGVSGDSNIIIVESDNKPSFDASDPNRFKSNPASAYLSSGGKDGYFKSRTLWAVSQTGDQLLSVTPA